MTFQRKFLFFLSAAIVLYGHVIFHHHAHAQDDDAEPAEEQDGNETDALKCFTCDSEDACSEEQEEETHDEATCEDSQGCWTWRTEDDGVMSYRRGCQDSCTDETMKESCQKANNKTECSICCSDNLCNSGLINGATSRMKNAAGLITLCTFATLLLASSN